MKSECKILKIQRLKDQQHNIDHAFEFILQLVRGAEKVGIILCKSADAGQAVKFTALLVTVNRSEFSNTDGQVFVRTGFALYISQWCGQFIGLRKNCSPSIGVLIGWKESLPYFAR